MTGKSVVKNKGREGNTQSKHVSFPPDYGRIRALKYSKMTIIFSNLLTKSKPVIKNV